MDKEKSTIETLMPANQNFDMDVARYKVAWLYVAGIQDKSTIDYIKGVVKYNEDRGFPTEVILLENDSKIRAYVYIFPDKETHKRYLSECDYESASLEPIS